MFQKKLSKNLKKIISILPNLTVITSNITCNYAGNYADFALQVIFEPYLREVIRPNNLIHINWHYILHD